MSTSSNLGKDIIKDWFLKQTDIKSIVDVGAGKGTYRNLLGQGYYWIAIEVWRNNVDKYELWKLYNKVYVDDIRSVNLPDADCIILGDVIEHMEKESGLDVLKKCISEYNHVVLSIPTGEYPQGEIEGNPYEKHLSTWTFDEIEKIADWIIKDKKIVNPLLPDVLQISIFIK